MILNIQRQPGANVIKVVESVYALLPALKASLPPAVDVSVLTDRTVTIRASIHDVEFELTLAVILVVLVIFVFLRNIPATIIPSLSVPLSLVGTFAVMYLLGFSLNNLSLMSLTIAAGFVVDDAIVMIENIARYVEKGDSPLEAALKGSEQIGFTIISLTISLIAVLIPLLFMGDVVGRLFREFAITLAVTILISAVVSLTLVPMMCAKLVRHHEPEEVPAWSRKAGAFFDGIIAKYASALNWVLDRQPLTLAVAVATLVLTVLLYVVIPKGFFPVQDTGLIQVITEGPQSASYEAMVDRQQALAAEILKDPAVVSLSSFVGVDGSNTTLNTGRMLVNLKPKGDRADSAAGVIRNLNGELAGVEGIAAYMQPVQDLTIDDRVSRTQFQFVLESANPADLNLVGPEAHGAPEPASRGERCRLGPLRQGPGRLHRDRPRHRREVRDHGGDDRQRPLRRVRPADHLDHLHGVQPVPRDHGGRSRAPALARLARADLRPVRLRGPGAPLLHREVRGAPRAPPRQPPEPVSREHDLLQRAEGRLARGARSRRSAPPSPSSACRPASPRPSRGRRTPSRARSRTSSS